MNSHKKKSSLKSPSKTPYKKKKENCKKEGDLLINKEILLFGRRNKEGGQYVESIPFS